MYNGEIFRFRPEGVPLAIDGVHYIVPVHTCKEYRIRVQNYLNCIFYHVRFHVKATHSVIRRAIRTFVDLVNISGEEIIYARSAVGSSGERTAKHLGFVKILEVDDMSVWALKVADMRSLSVYRREFR